SKLSARDRKSTRLNSSHVKNSYAVFCSKKKELHHHAFAELTLEPRQCCRHRLRLLAQLVEHAHSFPSRGWRSPGRSATPHGRTRRHARRSHDAPLTGSGR